MAKHNVENMRSWEPIEYHLAECVRCDRLNRQYHRTTDRRERQRLVRMIEWHFDVTQNEIAKDGAP